MSEVANLAGQWGAPAGLLLIVLFGGYKLFQYVLEKNAEREKALMENQQTMVPMMQQLTDSSRTNTELLVQIRDSVVFCDPRRTRQRDVKEGG